jgi:hypothetical protein
MKRLIPTAAALALLVLPGHAQTTAIDENAVKSCVAAQVQDYKNAGATVAVSDIDNFRASCAMADLFVEYLKHKNDARNLKPPDHPSLSDNPSPSSALDKRKLDALIEKNTPR